MNSTHRVEVVPIKLEPHTNSDNLSIIKVWGYTVCCRTADWQGVDKAAYIPPDSLVDTLRPEFSFLHKDERWERIKVKKLRGVISMGMLVPAPEGSNIGDDVAEQLGVKHYEPPENFTMGDENVAGPSLVSFKYDVDSYFKYLNLFNDGELVQVTEKIHGCVHEDTKILTSNGEISVKDIDIGYELLTYNIDKKVFENDIVVNKFISKGEDNWLEIELENGRKITITENHKVLTKEGYKSAKNLTEKDDIIAY